MTTSAAGWQAGARGRPPVFPWSIAGAPRSCLCEWEWYEPVQQFIRIHRNGRCLSVAHVSEAIMTGPAPGSESDQGNTTVQITKSQRTKLSDIQAALTLERGRYVGTKETVEMILQFWEEGHVSES